MGHAHADAPTVKTIWQVFWILFIITAAEFALALAVPETMVSRDIKNYTFIIMTLAKAFYIVAYFMHLKYEKLHLIYSILIPLIFIVGFVVAMLGEGHYWLMAR